MFTSYDIGKIRHLNKLTVLFGRYQFPLSYCMFDKSWANPFLLMFVILFIILVFFVFLGFSLLAVKFLFEPQLFLLLS